MKLQALTEGSSVSKGFLRKIFLPCKTVFSPRQLSSSKASFEAAMKVHFPDFKLDRCFRGALQYEGSDPLDLLKLRFDNFVNTLMTAKKHA